MTRFVHDETDAIDFGGGDIVHIRRKMSYAQSRALGSLIGEKDRREATKEYLIAVLEQNIVRWEGPGFQNGAGPVALTRENIDALDPDIGQRLVNEVAARNGVTPESLASTAIGSLPTPSDTAEASLSGSPSSPSASDTAGPGTS